MTPTPSVHELDFYRTPGPLTTLPAIEEGGLWELAASGRGVAELVQGLMLHEAHAELYGVQIPPERREEMQIRPAADLLARIRDLDPGPLREPRAPQDRLVGYCRHFAVLSTAFLRGAGVPARSRCGFFADVRSGSFFDHWLVEARYDDRWIRIDTSLDDAQLRDLDLDYDPQDVPRERFLSGAEAWQLCRSELADPSHFGIADWWGDWFVRNNLIRDLAALNKVEVLPWDAWGPMDRESAIGAHPSDLLLDEVATAATEGDWPGIRGHYERDDQLKAPAGLMRAASLIT